MKELWGPVMALTDVGQVMSLQRELAETRLLLRQAVAEQERLEAVNADLVEMLDALEAERDRVRAELRRMGVARV